MKNKTWCIDDVKGTVDEEKNTCKRINAVKHEDEKRSMGMQKKRIVKNIVRKNKERLKLKEAEKTKSNFDRKKNMFWK